jgi:hypothetical protein
MILIIDATPNAAFDYDSPNAAHTYCQALPSNPTPINPVFPEFLTGGVPGSFTGDAGLVFTDGSPSPTGQIDTENTTVGTHTVTNVVSNACGSDIKFAQIIINALPVKTISYPPGTFTTVDIPQSPTIGGATSVTSIVWTADPGLTIDSTTGIITPSTSTPGTYTVTWQFTTFSCPNTATTSITIT